MAAADHTKICSRVFTYIMLTLNAVIIIAASLWLKNISATIPSATTPNATTTSTSDVSNTIFKSILTVLTLLQSFLIGLYRYHNPDERWKAQRSFAIKMETIIWAYRTHTGPFDPSSLPPCAVADDILEVKLREWSSSLIGTSDVDLTNLFHKRNKKAYNHGQYHGLCKVVSQLKRDLILQQVSSVLSKETCRPHDLKKDMTFMEIVPEDHDNLDRSTVEIYLRPACCCRRRRRAKETNATWEEIANSTKWSDSSAFSRFLGNKNDHDDHFSPLTAGDYVQHRIKCALDFYQHRVPSYSLFQTFFTYVIAVLGVLAACAVIFELPDPFPPQLLVAVITAILTLFGGLEKHYDSGNKLRRYNNTISELKKIVAFWEGLTVLEKNKLQNITLVVKKAEQIILDVSV